MRARRTSIWTIPPDLPLKREEIKRLNREFLSAKFENGCFRNIFNRPAASRRSGFLVSPAHGGCPLPDGRETRSGCGRPVVRRLSDQSPAKPASQASNWGLPSQKEEQRIRSPGVRQPEASGSERQIHRRRHLRNPFPGFGCGEGRCRAADRSAEFAESFTYGLKGCQATRKRHGWFPQKQPAPNEAGCRADKSLAATSAAWSRAAPPAADRTPRKCSPPRSLSARR